MNFEGLKAEFAADDPGRNGTGDGPRPQSPFVDWPALWAADDTGTDWLHDPILARGRGHAIYAAHKVGKSLVMLYMAGRLATGAAPVVVIYLDYEMTEDDLRERLDEMGYGPSSDLSRLRYALLPSLPPLDTVGGGDELMKLVDDTATKWPGHHIAVCVDTLSRAVRGEENSADTVRAFYRSTGIRLKQRGATWARLDHAGKDPALGQRGSSAKGDDVDVTWRLEKTEGGITFKKDSARMRWVPDKVAYQITDDPLGFVVVDATWPAGTKEAAEHLDGLGVPPAAPGRVACRALREAGVRVRNEQVWAAQRWRREQAETILHRSPEYGERGVGAPRGARPGAPGANHKTAGQPGGSKPGSAGEQPGGPSGSAGGDTEGSTPRSQPRHSEPAGRADA